MQKQRPNLVTQTRWVVGVLMGFTAYIVSWLFTGKYGMPAAAFYSTLIAAIFAFIGQGVVWLIYRDRK